MNKCMICNKETQHSVSIGNDKYRLIYYTCSEHKGKVAIMILDKIKKGE